MWTQAGKIPLFLLAVCQWILKSVLKISQKYMFYRLFGNIETCQYIS